MIGVGEDTMGSRKSPHGFSYNTRANFVSCEAPMTEPDYVSKSGSRYWYTDQGVYRESDHFGHGVRSCDWTLDGYGYGYRMHLWPDPSSPSGWMIDGGFMHEEEEIGVYVCGFCPWEGFVKKS